MASAFKAPRSCLALALRFFLDGVMVRTCCPSISKFRLGFSLVTFFDILVCHCYFSFLSVGMLAMLWLGFFMGVFPFFPFAYDLSGLSVVGSSQSLLSCAFALTSSFCCAFALTSSFCCAFALTSSFCFFQVVRRPPGFGVLRRSCSLFSFCSFSVGLRDYFLVSSFLLFGVEV